MVPEISTEIASRGTASDLAKTCTSSTPAVLHRPVHNEVMIAGAAQHAPESVRGSCLRRILAHVCIGHIHLAFNLNLSEWHSRAIPGGVRRL